MYEILESYLKKNGLEPLPMQNCSLREEDYLEGLYAPGWRLRVERKISENLAENTLDHNYVSYQVTRLDLNVPCSLLLVFTLKQHRVTFLPQKIIKINYRKVFVDFENEVYGDLVIRDEDNSLLIGESSATRPQVWDKKLWPELDLDVSSDFACKGFSHPDSKTLHFTFTNGENKCGLDGGMMRCCNISGKLYKVFSKAAVRNINNPKSFDRIFVVIGRSDILEYVSQ